jgi:hypothetical protein
MNSFANEHSAANPSPADVASAALQSVRARREQVRELLARQAELFERLAASLPAHLRPAADSGNLAELLQSFVHRQEAWQQRHSEDLQQQEALLESVAEHLHQLSSQLGKTAPVPAPSPPAAAHAAPATSWEQHKQRMLAELEQGDEPEQTTDDAGEKEPDKPGTTQRRRDLQELLAQKNAEIEDLRRQIGEFGRSANNEVLDKDAMIQREREELRQLQEQWQEKLRKAEVEISIERAKLARERSQIEERLRTAEKTEDTAANDESSGGKSSRGRWLARLGLLDE